MENNVVDFLVSKRQEALDEITSLEKEINELRVKITCVNELLEDALDE